MIRNKLYQHLAKGGIATQNVAYYNGKIGSIEEMRVPMNDRACYFADGVYDAAFALNGTPLALDDHLRRFYRSAAKVDIEIPMAFEELRALAIDLCARVESPSSFLYMQATRGVGMRGHAYRFAGEKASLWLWVRPEEFDPLDRGYRCITLPDTRYLHCDIKTLNLLPNVIAAQRAQEAGCDEAIFHRDGRVTECAHSNVHILMGGACVTAPLDNLILPGVTRAHLLQNCRALGVPVVERPFTVAEMMDADEVFFTNCGSLCCRVEEIDGKAVGGRATELLGRLQKAMWDEALREARQNVL